MAPISTSPEFSREEVGLALRNPGMPLEGLRYPITPIGMHYLLIHFDIPHLDPATYRLLVTGLVDNPLELSLEDLRSRPRVTRPVMMECGGNGRDNDRRPRLVHFRPVERVEFSADDGKGWRDADLGDTLGPHGWISWSTEWDAHPSEYELCVRATDASGRAQPLDGEQSWNQGGYGVNVVQRVPVRVN